MGLTDVGVGLGFVLLIIAVIAVIILFVPFVLMIAWNFVMPQLFGLPAINIWMAFALWIIFGILFGSAKYVKSQ